MEINNTHSTAMTSGTAKNLAHAAERTVSEESAENQRPASKDTVDISASAIARLANENDGDNDNRIDSSAQAQQAVQALRQSDSAELLRVQGNSLSSQAVANLLS